MEISKINNTPISVEPKATTFKGSKNIEQEPDIFEASSDKKIEDPKFGKCYGQGLLFKLKSWVPFYGTYVIGKEYLEQENAEKDLKDYQQGKEMDSEKPGKLKSYLYGLGISTALGLPVIGSYLLGKQQIEQDNMVKQLNGEETKDPGFFRSLGKGIATKLASSIPILGNYVIGKEFAEQDKVVDKIEELKTQQAE